MADEPKPEVPQDSQPNISPAPNSVTDGPPPGEKGAPSIPANPAAAAPIAEALADGTMPTVLTPGQSHKKVAKGKTSLTSIYRKADILTTLFTFIGAVVVALIIVGGYAYFNKGKVTPVAVPKVTSLDKADLSKLDKFFSGNTAGNSNQILTVNSSSLFKGRVAVDSDLKVTGGIQISGTTALGDLTVDKTSTLGVTNIRGSLTTSGPANFQSPVILGAGATLNGNLAVSGNGTFGGSVSAGTINVATLSVGGVLNLNGHLSIGGQNPTASPAADGSSASVDGNDSAGTVTVTVPAHSQNSTGQLVNVTFRTAYTRAPHVVITPIGVGAALLEPFILRTATGFTIGAAKFLGDPNGVNNAVSYSFDYWVVQ